MKNVLLMAAPTLLVAAHIHERIVPIGRSGTLLEVDLDDLIAVLPQGPAGLFAQAVLDAGDDDALSALKDVGEHIAAGLAGAAGADDAVVVVQPRDPGIVADTGAFV